MKSDFFKKLRQSKRDVHISSEVKQKIRNNLLNYMENNPVSDAQTIRLRQQEGFVFKIIKLFNHMKTVNYKMLAPIAILVFILAGAGTAYASNDALPGDKLYPFKLNVNEQVKSNLTFSEEAQAEAQLDLYEQRLDEAVILSSQNRLDSKLESKIEKLFAKYQSKVDRKITQLEKKGKTELATRLRTRLESVIIIHQEILAQLNNQNSLVLQNQLNIDLTNNTDQEIVGETEVDQDDNQESEENVSHKQVAAQNKINTATKIIANIEAFINRKSIDSEQNVRALTHLQSATDLLTEANFLYDQGNYEAAFRLAGKSLIVAQEAKTFIRLNAIVDLRVDRTNKPDSENKEKNTEYENSDSLNDKQKIDKQKQPTEQNKSNDRTKGSAEIELNGNLDLQIRSQSINLETESSVRSGVNLGL